MKRRGVSALGIFIVCCPCASALNPSLDINQYAHKSWTVREGFFKGFIASIAQTPDGYLWLGTEFGLVRFDGVRPVQWNPPAGEHLPGSHIQILLAARDGRLWIGTTKGLASWKDGKFTHYSELAGQSVGALLEDREGTVWTGGFANTTGRLCAIRSGRAQCYGEDGSLGHAVISLCEDSQGDLWATGPAGLWHWKPGPPRLYPMPDRALDLIEGDNGALLTIMNGGIMRLVGGKAEAYALPDAAGKFNARHLLRDRNGGLWIGTADRGLLHVHQGRADFFAQSDGLSADFILALFEDREGSIWIASSNGLDRFRDFIVPTISARQGLSNATVLSVLAARDGSVWLGTIDGLNRWSDGQITIYRKRRRNPALTRAAGSGVREIANSGLPDDYVEALYQDDRGRIWASTHGGIAWLENDHFIPVKGVPGGYVQSIASDSAGDLWISDLDRGLFHLHGETMVERIPWDRLGNKGHAVALLADPVRGGLWLGFVRGGVAFLKDGRVRALYASTEGLGAGRVEGLQLDRDGTLWAATEGGLSRLKNGRVATLSSKNGLPCDTVHWAVEDDDHSCWLYMACGLVRLARADLDAWAADSKRTIRATVFDGFDGVTSHSNAVGFSPRVAKTADGRLWFLPFDGVSVIDPRHLPFNKLPPPVHIEKVTVDGKPHEATPGFRLPPLVRDVWIDYTALSLVAPEKVHFRYKLEGQDPDWIEVVNVRQAQYSNLAPRHYRFRVMASNNSGVWNETGDTLEFSVAAAYYQTNWFRALLAATVLAMMWAAYQFRIWQVQRESRHLRDVIETIPAYVWSALPDGVVDFINRRWLEFTGFSLTQALGWGWTDAVHPEDRAWFVEAWRADVASGKPVETEVRMRGADGQYRWQLIRSVPQHDRSGKIVKWYAQTTDIDDRKRAEETLRESETRFRTLVNHVADAMFVYDFEQGTISDVNPQACESLGYTRQELVGTTGLCFHLDSDRVALDSVAQRAAAGDTVFDTHWHRRKDGTLFPVEVHTSLFWSGGRRFLLKLARDITERKCAEEERERLRKMEADLAHINRVSMMGELAASVAHEVNQPLTGIVNNGSACLRLLAGDAPDLEETREAVRDIVRDGKRAGEVIARIRALTKRTSLPRATQDLNETIREVLAIVGDEARKKSVVIRTQLADDLFAVFGDRVQLQQVLLNLVINAMDAMSGIEDRERQLVIMTRNIDPDQTQVTVEDSGTGLDPNTMASIFDPFYTTKSGGMGMGLSISRSIVHSHGGRLWATPNDGPGTSFHFTVPKSKEEETNAGAAAN